MSKETVGFWLLLIGVVMLVWYRGSTIYKGGGFSMAYLKGADAYSRWQDISVLAVSIGTVLLWRKIQ